MVLSRAVIQHDLPLGWSAARLDEEQRSSLPPGIDADRDGLSDAEEEQLAQRFAPVVTLHADDPARPASVRWLLARLPARLMIKDGQVPVAGLPTRLRSGSPDPRDWVTYVHVYPMPAKRQRAQTTAAGVFIQYWFFYPYNDGPLFFDHEADWEHVTVELDSRREPNGVWAARHDDNAPGQFRAWSGIRKQAGTHPEVLSALGTHATYFDLSDAHWYDRVGRCARPRASCRHPRWRTWEGGGLEQLGEREAPRDPLLMMHARPWGLSSLIPGCGAPHGPSFQRGWCAGGAPGCGMYGAF